MLLLLLLLAPAVGCAGKGGPSDLVTALPGTGGAREGATVTPATAAGESKERSVDLTIADEDVSVGPLPLRAGFPFTVTAAIHNNKKSAVVGIPVMVYLSPLQEQIGFSPFLELLTVTLSATQPAPVEVPVVWNLAGGEYRLWVQVNRSPAAWLSQMPCQPEPDLEDNLAVLELTVSPFDAYESSLCAGRVDAEIGPGDVKVYAGGQAVSVRVHNTGNRALYNLPVVLVAGGEGSIAYTPAIAPCGGSAEVAVSMDRPLAEGEPLTVLVNPQEWEGSLAEDDFGNNRVVTAVSLAAGTDTAPGMDLVAYDFSVAATDLETPEPWILLVTVHNLGTQDAAMVPIRVENQAGRHLTDAIPVVQGNGTGVAAIRVGMLWTRGATLTLTVNPAGARGAYPEANRENNVASITLP